MAESHEAAPSTAGTLKKSTSLDDDFGTDFLSSWKSSKARKDSIDFEVEAVPRNGKKSFNFDKLDDLELGGDFKKISSFKMDMSDLDFSIPCKKAEKSKEKTSKESDNQEPKQDKFSFTFDFNELDRFSLDSNLLKGPKRPKSNKNTDGNGPDCSAKHDMDRDSRSNSIMSTDAFENKETKKSLILGSTATSGPEHSAERNFLNASSPKNSADPGHQKVSRQSITTSEKQESITEGNNPTHSSGSHRELSDGSCPTKQYTTEKAAENCFLQSVPGDASGKMVPESGVLTSSDHLIAKTVIEHENSERSIESSHSRNSSSANLGSSRRWSKASITKLLNTCGEIENQQENQGEVNGQALHHGESIKDIDAKLDIHDGIKHIGDKQILSPKLLSSSLNTIVGNRIVKEKPTVVVHIKYLDDSAENRSEPTPGISNQLYTIPKKMTETINSCPLHEERESKQKDERAEIQSSGTLKLFNNAGTTGVSVISRLENNSKQCDTSFYQVHPSKMANQAAASCTAKVLSSILPIKGPIPASAENQDCCPKYDEKHDVSSSTISRLTKLNMRSLNLTLQKETKSAKLPKGSFQSTLSRAPKSINAAVTEMRSLLSPPLKRKVSKLDLEVSKQNSLKRVMALSAEGRKSFEASPEVDRQLVPGTESTNAHPHKEIVVDNQNLSDGSPMIESMLNFQVPILIENDGNVEKAEESTKELDAICSMLKKKHEEAKDLLVRAVVNSNTLLMLNHPMFEEKISLHYLHFLILFYYFTAFLDIKHVFVSLSKHPCARNVR